MKRILLGILLCILGALSIQAANPWAELQFSTKAREDEEKQGWSRYQPKGVTVLPRILQGHPLRVNIMLPENASLSTCNTAKQQISNAYNNWFNNAANTIKNPNQNRSEEFKDVLPTLEKGVSVQATCIAAGKEGPLPTADMTVNLKNTAKEVEEECKNDQSLACITTSQFGENPIQLTIPTQVSQGTLNHEIGHTLGLADSYRDQSSLSRRSSKQNYDSIMNAGNEGSFSADDADGLINIIDAWNIYEAKKNSVDWQQGISKRVLQGWDSLYVDPETKAPVDHYKLGNSETLLNRNR